MPADTLTISLTGPLLDEVRAAAEARGLTPEEYVRKQIAWDIALGDGFRQLILRHGKSGYVIRYRVLDDSILITRVWHGKEERG